MSDNFQMCLELTEELEKHKKRINQYKQKLKRKEQECERLNNDNHTLLVTRQKLLNDLWIAEESLKDFKEICDKQCEKLEAYKMEAEEGKEINAELKAENEELKDKLNCCFCNPYVELNDTEKQRKCVEVTECFRRQLDQLKAENKELKKCYKNNSALLDFEETNTTKLVNKVMKLEKTLTEIKEIAEKNLNIHTCAFKGCGYDLITKQILQKISECEGNDEQL